MQNLAHEDKDVKPLFPPAISASLTIKEDVESSKRVFRVRLPNALAYIDAIKAQYLPNKREVYDAFMTTLNEFRAGKLDTVEVMDRVASLLQDSPCLVVGFNAFLPQEYHLELSGDGKLITVKTPSETETIGDYKIGIPEVEFVKKVKEKLADEPDKFAKFLQIFSPTNPLSLTHAGLGFRASFGVARGYQRFGPYIRPQESLAPSSQNGVKALSQA